MSSLAVAIPTAGERLAAARALIARIANGDAALAPDEPIPVSLGEIVLRPAQRVAASELHRLIARHGGALLADPVGSGKTYIALAVSAAYAHRVVIAPAALRDMWRDALGRAHLDAQFVSYEQLSRDGDARAAASAEFVIMDEAHHVRNPASRRYAAVVSLCRDAPVLLLSATPIQNALSDLVAQLALFLGARAAALPEHELARFVVRSPVSNERDTPLLDGPHALTLDTPDDCLDVLAGLPPPTPASDEGMAGALLTYSLVKQWASSRAALMSALKRRLARAVALAAVLESGRTPTRAELAAWAYADGALQLAFPELLASAPVENAALLGAVQAQERAVREAMRVLVGRPDPDGARVRALRALRARHPNARIIAFSEFAETVQALGRCLVRDGGVAWLTSRGARIASGTISRREVLAQFTPSAAHDDEHGNVASGAAQIALLLTTDVLSEGLNLQQASVVVHLDWPWNPARLEQRVGRVRRQGSAHHTVTAYTLTPPANAERLLQIERRLATKLGIAHRTIGSGLPTRASASDGTAAELGRISRILARWRSGAELRRDSPTEAPLVAGVRADALPRPGFLAMLEHAGNSDHLLVADIGGGATTAAASVRRALDLMDGGAVAPDLDALGAARLALDVWWAYHRGARALDHGAAASARARHTAAERLEAIRGRVPRHRRSAVAALIAAARDVVAAPMSRGAEQRLAILASAPLDDEAWLRALVRFTAPHNDAQAAREPATPPLRVLIVLQPTRDNLQGARTEFRELVQAVDGYIICPCSAHTHTIVPSDARAP